MKPQFALAGAFLRKMRMDHYDLSQAKLAKKIGVHVQFVSNWERGLCAPPDHCLKKLLPKSLWHVYAAVALDDNYSRLQRHFRKMGLLKHDLR